VNAASAGAIEARLRRRRMSCGVRRDAIAERFSGLSVKGA